MRRRAIVLLLLGLLTAASVVAIEGLTRPGTSLGWSQPSLEAPPGFDAISCASSHWCMATIGGASGATSYWNGQQWTPAGTQWTTELFHGSYVDVDSLSCPRTNFCMAIANSTTTVNPSSTSSEVNDIIVWRGRQWTLSRSLGRVSLAFNVTCASVHFCMAEDGIRTVTWNGTSWSTATDDRSIVEATVDCLRGQCLDLDFAGSVTCANSRLCLAIDLSGDVAYWQGQSWSTASAGSNARAVRLAAVSCASRQFCAGVTSAGGAEMWDGINWSTPQQVDGNKQMESISCPSPRFCVAFDVAGNAVTWNGQHWMAPRTVDAHSSGASRLSAYPLVSCPTSTFCAAGDELGYVTTYNAP